MNTPHFAAVSIVVSDMSASIAFYSALGLRLSSGGPEEGHSEFTHDGLRIMLDVEDIARSIDPGWTRPTGGPAISLAFECASPEAVDAVHAQLTSAGAAAVHAPFDAAWGQRYATIADPDGNPVDVFAWQE